MYRFNQSPETTAIVMRQIKETVTQENEKVTLRLGVVTCVCGEKRAVVNMYRCLYCKVWFCHTCAEEHFGKTVEEYYSEKDITNNGKKKEGEEL